MPDGRATSNRVEKDIGALIDHLASEIRRLDLILDCLRMARNAGRARESDA